MSVVFRLDSSPSIGLGHLMRCLVLAKKFKKKDVLFLSYEADKKLIKKHGYKFLKLQTKSIDEVCLHVKKIDPKLLIIDSYDIGYKEEKKLKKNLTCKLMVLDDVYEKHYADILLNHNIYAQKKLYKNKVPPFCKVLCGKKYTLIRDEFLKEKQKKRAKKGLFVSFGGSDSKNLTLKLLKKLPKSLHVKVATTSSNTNLAKLEKYAQIYPNISLHVNSKHIAKLMNKSEFGVISPSVIAHEALCLSLPFLAIKTAKNQALMYKYLKKQGITCKKSLDDMDIVEVLKQNGISF